MVDPAILWQAFWNLCKRLELQPRVAAIVRRWVVAAVADPELEAVSPWLLPGIAYSEKDLEEMEKMISLCAIDFSVRITSNCVSVDSRLQRSNFNVINAYHMLMVGVGRKPWYDCAWASYVCSFNVCWSQMRDVTANDHRAGSISRCPSIRSNASNAHSMWLVRARTKRTKWLSINSHTHETHHLHSLDLNRLPLPTLSFFRQLLLWPLCCHPRKRDNFQFDGVRTDQVDSIR